MTLSKAYQTIIVLAAGFILIGYLLTYKGLAYGAYFIHFSLGVLILSALHEKIATFIAKAWMKLGEAMGKVTSTVLLTLIFFAFLTPLAVLKKMLSKKALQNSTTWVDINKTFNQKMFERPW